MSPRPGSSSASATPAPGAQAYRDRIRLHRDAIEDLARRRGWTLTIHRTDRPTTEAALRLVTLVHGGARRQRQRRDESGG